jgi:flagellar assembly factor FliW
LYDIKYNDKKRDFVMLIDTRDFGEYEIIDDSIITFPEGIPGFENLRGFAVLSPLGEGVYPCWLQSVEDPETCFIVFNPFEIISDYNLDEWQLLDELDVGEATPVSAFVISIIPDEYKNTTVNLRCPLVVNLDTMQARQIILDEDYPVRHPLFITVTEGGLAAETDETEVDDLTDESAEEQASPEGGA